MPEIATHIKFKGRIFPSIHKFYQRDTYYGLIEGSPNTAMNAEYLASFIKEAKSMFHLENVHMVKPEENIIKPDSPIRIDSNGQHVYRAMLPKVVCMVELSSRPVKDQSKEWSRLGLIWLQDYYAFPIANDIRNQIELLDWESLSVDEYY